MNISRSNLNLGLALTAIYALLLARWGYIFGSSDHIEVLPYALFLQDASLYPHDFYIQHISEKVPNERYIFSRLISFVGFGAIGKLLIFLLHYLTSMLLLSGLYKIARMFIETKYLAWLSLLILFIPFYAFNLGGNELYYNMFIASNLSKAIAVWAIYYFLKDHYYRAFLVLIPSAFVHPVAGAQVYLILAGVLFLGKLLSVIEIPWKKVLVPPLLFFLTGGLWILFLKLNFDEGEIAKQVLFEIMEFRVPHHYMPAYYMKKSWLVLLPLFLVGLIFYYRTNKKIALFFLVTGLGLVAYTLGIYVLQSSSILSAQWFKSTIWLEAFSVIAVCSIFELLVPFVRLRTLRKLALPFLVGAGLFCAVLIGVSPSSFPWFAPYDFGYLDHKNYVIDIAKKAKEKTPKDALFLVPVGRTAFKYYSQRSSYVDYKAVVHRKDALPIWYARLDEVYNIDIDNRRAGENIEQIANSNYRKLRENDFQKFEEKGIEYILTFSDHKLNLPLVASNKKYLIYSLD